MVATSDRLLSTSEAAERLGVSRWTLRRLAQDGELTPMRIRSAVRYDAADLEAYLSRARRRTVLARGAA